MRARILSCMAGAGVAIVLGVGLFSATRGCSAENQAAPSDPEAFQKEKERVFALQAPEDEAGFTRMPPPKPGEWLATYREPPQPVEKFKVQAKIKPTADRRTIVIQPLGGFNAEQKKILEIMRQYAEVFFQLPARLEPEMEFPPKGTEEDPDYVRMVPIGNRREGYDRQYDADTILEKILLKKVPKDAAVYVGITMQDLYVPSLNYVFGLGSFEKRVGVYSLIRYFPEFWGRERKAGDDVLALTRSCKVLNHEIGHIFGMKHCIFYKCTMNGSNSLAETDAAPIHLCPVCHRKMLWSIKFDPLKRFDTLRAFYKENGLAAESDWMSARIENWKKLSNKKDALENE